MLRRRHLLLAAAGLAAPSLARAQAVFEYLVARSRLRPNQLFVVGHGGNHPVVSNATTAGKLHNRRVELAIYPDRVGP